MFSKSVEQRSVSDPKCLSVDVQAEVHSMLNKRAKGNPFAEKLILLSALGITCFKYCRAKNFTIASSESVSFDAECSFYQFELTDGDRVVQILEQMRSQAEESRRYLNFPIQSVIQRYRLFHNEEFPFRELCFEYYHGDETLHSVSDEVVFRWRSNTSLKLEVAFDAGVKDERLIRSFVDSYQQVVRSILHSLDVEVGNLPWVSLPMENEVFRLSHSRENVLDAGHVLDIIDKVCADAPDDLAVVAGDVRLTYRELAERSDLLAGLLQQFGVRAGDRVVALLSRSEKNVIAMLAIWKCGALYVPLDYHLPKARLDLLLKDVAGSAVITEQRVMEKCHVDGNLIVFEDISWGDLQLGVGLNGFSRHEYSYVIYTSGSTGIPKGIVQTHRMLYNLIRWQEQFTNIGSKLQFYQYASFTFDVSIQDVCYVLSTNGCLHIALEEIRLDFRSIHRYIVENEIQAVYFPFSVFVNFFGVNSVDDLVLTPLKHIICGGEQVFLGNSVRDFMAQRPDVFIHNQYGPSETHVVTNLSVSGPQTTASARLPIGYPVSQTSLYVLDEKKKIVPFGVKGEVYISGWNLAAGYWNMDDLTRERFFSLPVGPDRVETLYRTGDLGVLWQDGVLEYCGRADDQLKIKGYRIEPGEIQSVILSLSDITDAIAVALPDLSGDLHLILYYSSVTKVDERDLRNFAESQLPQYMVPSFFVWVDKFPTTANGKLDKSALPNPFQQTRVLFQPDLSNPILNNLHQLWCRALGVADVGIDDAFFSSGGHSLKAIKLLSLISKEMRISLELSDVFRHNTIRNLADYIATSKKSSLEIKPIDERQSYEVSHGQYRLWVLQQLLPENTAYNISAAFELNGVVDLPRLEQALRLLVARHEVLRTNIRDVDGEPFLFVARVETAVPSLVIFTLDSSEPEETWQRIANDNANFRFKLESGPLLRIAAITNRDSRTVLSITIHHIIADAWSLEIIFEELLEYYSRLASNQYFIPVPLEIQFKDYAAWQRELVRNEELREAKSYWIDRFKSPSPALIISSKYNRNKTLRGKTFVRPLPTALADGLSVLSKSNGASTFMSVLAISDILLSKYTGEKDITVGIPGTPRSNPQLAQQVGFYVNTLPHRCIVRDDRTFLQFLSDVRGVTLDAFRFQHYPIDQLMLDLKFEGGSVANDFFNVMVNYQNVDDQFEWKMPGVNIKSFPQDINSSKFDLTFTIIEEKTEVFVAIEYSVDLFSDDEIKVLSSRFIHLLRQICQDPSITIGRLQLANEDDRKQVTKWCEGAIGSPSVGSVVDRFRMQVKSDPIRPAICCGTKVVSYAELERHSEEMAIRLRDVYDLKRGDVVAIDVGRNENMILGVLAILKSGAAYLPISRDYPAKRVSLMLEETAAKVVIVDRDDQTYSIPYFDVRFNQGGVKSVATSVSITADDSACIMYTSGSGGVPKGAVITHRGIIRLVVDTNYCDFLPTDRVLQVSNFAFDGSTFDIFGALLNGSCLHLVDREKVLDIDFLKLYIESQNINVALFPTSLFNRVVEQIPEVLKNFTRIYFGGEAASIPHVKTATECISANCRLINAYGPTEGTVISTSYTVAKDDDLQQVPIGRPISNTSVYIVDEGLNLQPLGIVGEICIGGEGVAKGYVNQPELTAKSFISSPFRKDDILYKTGDMGRWLPDGTIEFFYRKDGQVKIRGYRVECGEVEQAIFKYGVSQCAVLPSTRAGSHDKFLVAFVEGLSEEELERLKDHLRKTLPNYMIPSTFHIVNKFELNQNGKVDRARLLSLAIQGQDEKFKAPATELQQKMAKVWLSTLKVNRVGVDDNFFELGGNSLFVIKTISEMNRELGWSFKYTDLYNFPTIAQLSSLVDSVALRSETDREIVDFDL